MVSCTYIPKSTILLCKVPSIGDPGSMHRNLFFTGDNGSALQVYILKETIHFS